MKFPVYIASRYLKSKSGNNIINIVTILACLGVVAGTTALFIVLSVFSGIKNYSLTILDSRTPDIRITPKKGKTFGIDNFFTKTLENSPSAIIYTKVLEERAFLKHKQKEEIAYIKGVNKNFNNVIPSDSLVVIGEWLSPNSSNACIVDYSLAIALDLNAYTHKLDIYVPKPGKGYLNNPKKAFQKIKPQIIGITSNPNQNEKSIVHLPIQLAQKLLNKQANEYSLVDIKLKNKDNTKTVVEYLKNNLPNYKVVTKEEINGSFYKILNSEKLIAYLVSLLVIIMVISNTSGTLIMVIVDKKENIQTLINMGSGISNIRKIFSIYGFMLNLIGMLFGLLLGFFLIWLQINFSLIMITPIVPYPVAFELDNICVVFITIILLGSLSSLLASSRITRKYAKNRP